MKFCGTIVFAMKQKTTQCPTCRKAFDPMITVAMPFCSDRCRLIDLGQWLNEEHGLPWEPTGGDESFDEDLQYPPG